MAVIIRAMPALHASDALLPSGWAKDVLIEWDEAGVISRVTTQADRPAEAAVASGIVLPGMPNVHSHSFQRAMAGLAEFRGHPTDDFWTWREEMYRLVRLLEPEDIEAISAQLYVEMLKHGYTTVAEFHYLHNDRNGAPYADRAELAHGIVGAASTANIALTLLPVLYAHGGFGHKPLSPAQRRFRGDPGAMMQILRSVADFHLPAPLLRLGVAPHSARAVDALLLTEMVDSANRVDATMPIHMHVSEQTGEVAECLQTHGVTPLTWISDLVPVDSRWCFIHATHLTALEMRKLSRAGSTIGLCPTTEANLGDGIFDFVPWFEARAPWGIGGDSHVSVSPFDELRALEYSQRLRMRVRVVASEESSPDVAANLWSAAAAGGARAVAHPVGAIAQGLRADLVVLDGEDVDFEGLAAPARLGVAMFSGNSNRVRDVYVGGRQVVDNRRHAFEDEARAAFRRALARLRAAP
jgi:formimidoylglutamate deiminase